MTTYKRQCNFCKKTFDEMDEHLDFGFDMVLPYGTTHDMAHLELDMCVDCFNQFMDEWVLPRCKISPLIETLSEEDLIGEGEFA